MSYDLKRSHFSLVLEKPVLAGAVITEEGVLLQATIDAATGSEVVSMATNDASLVIAGFAIRDNADNATAAEVENLGAVPAGLLMNLSNNNIVSTADTGLTTNIQVSADGTPLTLANTGGAASGVVGVNPTTGALDFHVDELGQTIVATYTYNLTVAEARLKFFQRNINNEASTLFGSVGVGQGHGEVFTDQFDATVDWSVAAQIVHSGDAGTITNVGGTLIDARVISVPNVNNPLLGLSFDISGATTTN
jgi:hypothetical protein